jgi:hypothetical protein
VTDASRFLIGWFTQVAKQVTSPGRHARRNSARGCPRPPVAVLRRPTT